jgi:amino acid adenylation domain-containing protein
VTAGGPDLATLSREEKLALLARLAREKERAARTFPLSFAQQRLWVLDRLDPGHFANNIFRAVAWSGPLDVGALRRSLAEIVRRHEALRACFVEHEGEPGQRVTAAREVLGEVEELGGLAPERRRERAGELAREESRHAFDLANGPVFRARLLRLAAEEHVLLLNMHHIVSDGWSLGLLFHELTTLYRAFAEGLPSPLPEPALQYPDFAEAQRRHLSGARLADKLRFWSERLKGFPDRLDLPFDRPRPAGGSLRGAIEPFELPADLSREVRALARREGATPFMALLAAFELTLFRWSGQRAFLLGTNVAGRDRPELEGLIGDFAETLVLRARVESRTSFRELLAWARNDLLEAQVHRDLPFERLVEHLRPEREMATNPLFQVSFVFQNAPAGGAAPPGVSLGTLPVERGLAKLDLTLEMVERDGTFSGYLEYNTDLFERATAARLAADFVRLLSAAAADPDRAAGELPRLTAEERHRALFDWNPRPPAPPALVAARIAERARLAPESPAVLFGGQALSFEELDSRANRLARALRRLGVGADTRVGVCLERSLHLPVALLGVLKSGGAYVPLDPGHPADRLAFQVADTGMPVVLTSSDLAGTLPASGARRLAVDDPLWTERESSAPPSWSLDPEGLAYVIYTSGSTGTPKGVGVPHRALANHAEACRRLYGLGPGDRVLQFAAITFDLSVEEIFPTWVAGGAVVPRPAGVFPTFEELERIVAGHGVTVANLPTSYWHEWVEALAEQGRRPPQPLRAVIVGTEQALPERLERWRALAGDRVRWFNGYGATETAVTVLAWESAGQEPGEPERRRRVPVGRPVAGCRVYVLDESMEPVPPGAPGDLYAGGACLSRGYLGAPERTAEAFTPDPFAAEAGDLAGSRLYRLGDRGRYRADGTIECLGRTDAQVKIRGFRVEPGEVEAALAGHPAVRDCAVLIREDARGARRLVACVAAAPGGAAGADDLRGFLGERLPEYMIPSGFVLLDALPLTPNGKVDRRALARLAPEPEPGEGGEEAPRTPVEEVVAGLWASLLGRERVGRGASFFFAQERLWFLDRLSRTARPTTCPRGAARGGSTGGPGPRPRRDRPPARVPAHHLRPRGGRPVQVIEPPAPVPLPVVDLRALADPRARRCGAPPARRPPALRPGRGPLLRSPCEAGERTICSP